MDEDIEFSYDTKSFKSAMTEMTDSFNRFTKSMDNGNVEAGKKSGDMMNKSVQKTKLVGASMAKLAFLGSLVYGVFKLIKRALGEIPEIGSTFKAAGDIIMRNLLWPLRVQLIPLLQKVLDWTKNNRTLFIQWGYVIVNVFKSIGQVFKALWDIVQAFTKGFKKEIGDAMNFSVKGIMDIINLAIFKITALLMLLSIKLQPIAEGLGETFGIMIKYIKDFAKGFAEGLASIDLNILESVDGLLSSMNELLREMQPLLEPLSWLFGKVFGGIAATLQTSIDLISMLLRSLAELTKALSGKQGFMEALDNISAFSGQTPTGKAMDQKMFKEAGIDKILRKLNLSSVQLVPREERERRNQETNNNPTFNIVVEKVETKGDPYRDGQDVGKGIMDQIYSQTMMQRALQGGK